MKKRWMGILMASVIMSTFLAGCGANAGTAETAGGKMEKVESEEAAEREEITFWSWWRAEARKPYIDQMVADFNESQDKYHVTYEVVPWGDIFTKNIAQIAAGNPCDVIVNSMEEVKLRAENGQVEPLDDYIPEGMTGQFLEQCMNACVGNDGKIYAIPLSIDTRVIYYNKDHFEEVGIKPEDIKTWEDLEEAAKKLDIKSESGYERIGLLPTMGNGGVNTWLVNANGGQCWYDEEGGEITVNSEVNKEAFAWIKEQNDRYGEDTVNEIQAAFSNGMADPFASGVLSMILNTSSYISALRQTAPDLNYGVIKVPEFEEGNGNVVNGGGFVMEIPKGAKHPEGAFEFIKYVTSKSTQDYLSVSIGDFSARNDFDDTTEFFKQPNIPEMSEALKSTYYTVLPSKIKGFQDLINPIIDEGILGITSTDEALDNAQKAFEDFVGNL